MILHIDFDSFFASVEQQANPRLRGKPIGVSGGDRLTRTVVGAASIEAKRYGVKTGMKIPDALKLCPELILVKGDSDKYLEINKKFLNILKRYTDKMEVFSIDEVFLEIKVPQVSRVPQVPRGEKAKFGTEPRGTPGTLGTPDTQYLYNIASDIKERIRKDAGEFISCSIGISYNKMLAKLAGSIYKRSLRTNLPPELERFVLKPNGLVGILDQESAIEILDRVKLDDICGIGFRTVRKLNNMGIYNFADLREVPLPMLLASFKSYGQVLYDFARGIDPREVVPYFEKAEVKSIGHRHTTGKDISDPTQIKQILLKLCELVARRARAKKLEGKTISFWLRWAFDKRYFELTGDQFKSTGMQSTIAHTNDGLDIFNACWTSFYKLWDGKPIRLVGVSISNLRPTTPQNMSLLEEIQRREVITRALDKINNRYGEFTLQRGILLGSKNIRRMANSFMSDRRFKI